VTQWLTQPGHDVFFFDEGRFGLKPVVGRRWAKRGVRPTVTVHPRYHNFYAYAAVSPLTGDSFMLLLPWVNTEVMSLYLAKMSEALGSRQALVVLDRAGWHRSKDLLIPPNIHLEFLPPYSPELNPTERLWLVTKADVCRNQMPDSEDQLCQRLTDRLAEFTNHDIRQLCRCSYLPSTN
jgi:transposase